MAAKISRSGGTATAPKNNDAEFGQSEPNGSQNGSGPTNPGPSVKDAPTQGNLGTLNFTVKKTEIPVSKRGAGRKPAELPEEFVTAAIKMYNNNPANDADEMEAVTLTLTNRQIQQLLVAGVKKIQSHHMPNATDGVWLKSSVNTIDGKRSNDAADADKLVTVVWTVRKRTQAEVDRILEKANAA